MEDDNGLSANDPYRNMDSGESEIQPDFLKNNIAKKALGGVEKAASLAAAAGTGGASAGASAGGAAAGAAGKEAAANGAKTGASAVGGSAQALRPGSIGKAVKDGFKSSVASAQENETNPRGLYSGDGNSDEDDDSSKPGLKMPGIVKMLLPILLLLFGLVVIVFVIIAWPIMMIGAIDYNLQKALGFTDTVGILEKVGEAVTGEFLANGEVPHEYASDLADAGVLVGQVTTSGDFVRTDTYIADIESKNDLVAAASGFSYISQEDGELAVLFNGNVIKADDFIAAVESDPTLYAAYSNAADISAKYYYGEDVNNVFKEMGISRGVFNEWESTGDYATDEASFVELLNGSLNDDSELVVGGADTHNPIYNFLAGLFHVENGSWCMGGDGEECEPKDISELDANGIVSKTAEETKEHLVSWHMGVTNGGERFIEPEYSEDATTRAVEVLNSAVSANEPYLATKVFMAIEEPIQRARAGDNGPINQMMNVISKSNSVSYQTSTGGTETKNTSILETVNFQAAVGEKPYDVDEAANFGRDRVLKITDEWDEEHIKANVVSTDGEKNSTSVSRNGTHDSASKEVLGRATQTFDLAILKKNSEVFQSAIGANRLLEGGSFLSNTINQRTIGAMPSDEKKIAQYDNVVEETIARRADADRATKSPFNISSPNTFLGSIVHTIATTALGNSSGGGMMTAASTAVGAAGSAVAGLFNNTAMAEAWDQKFTTLSGNDCKTVEATKTKADLYCTSHNTVGTDHLDWKFSDWKASEIGGFINEDGTVNGELEKFVLLGMDRYSTVGVSSAEVCDKYNDLSGSKFRKFLRMFTDMIGLYNKCRTYEPAGDLLNGWVQENLDVPETIATGAEYTFGPDAGTENGLGQEGVELFSGYMTYNQVKSLLTGTKSAVAIAKDNYYAEHPKDESRAGKIARISGLTKGEAEIALSYVDYLNTIANYDASTRYKFGAPLVAIEKPILEVHSSKLTGDLYAWHQKEIEYKALRNRQEIVS